MSNLPAPRTLYCRRETSTLRQNIPDDPPAGTPTSGSMSLAGSREHAARSDYPHGLLESPWYFRIPSRFPAPPPGHSRGRLLGQESLSDSGIVPSTASTEFVPS